MKEGEGALLDERKGSRGGEGGTSGGKGKTRFATYK